MNLDILDKLGDNKVFHAIIPANDYQEGSNIIIETPHLVVKDKAIVMDVLDVLMYWRNPSVSLLSSTRQKQEKELFKSELDKSLNAFDHKIIKKLKLDIVVIRSTLFEKRELSESVLEFLGNLWNVTFCSSWGVHGVLSDRCYEFKDDQVVSCCLATHRKTILNERSLKTAKEMKEWLLKLKVPHKGTLKGDLEAIIKSLV